MELSEDDLNNIILDAAEEEQLNAMLTIDANTEPGVALGFVRGSVKITVAAKLGLPVTLSAEEAKGVERFFRAARAAKP